MFDSIHRMKMAEGNKAPDMSDLLEYFEARSRSLDAEGLPVLDTSTLQFISLIKFNGVPILPPVLSPTRREEMQCHKREALKRENRNRNKQREELQAKVQSIVAGVEERRAAKQAAKSGSTHSSPASTPGKSSSRRSQGSEVITKLSSTKSAFSSTTKGIPTEIVINVPVSQSKTASTASSKSSSVQSKAKTSSSKSSPSVTTTKSSTSTASPRNNPPSKTAKSTFTNYKSLGKLGSLSKQKSFSSQHLDRTPSRMSNHDSDASTSPVKDVSLSPNSKGLLPHPPVGRPPSRGSNMRQSSSTPDLRNIDAGIRTEDLKKPLPARSYSPKGGRPQTSDNSMKQKTDDKSRKTTSRDANQTKTKQQIKPEKSSLKKESENIKDAKVRKPESPDRGVRAKQIDKESSRTTRGRSPISQQALQNPLEALEQEISIEEESDRHKRHEKHVRQELDPIQTAAAELFPFPISEEQALATLDSLQSDFASLEQADSLPCDYNGIPLTNPKQQQIIHMLTKLSQALNIEDTLTSTAGSLAGGEPVKDNRQQPVRDQSSKYHSGGGDKRSVPNGARGRSQYEPIETVDISDELSVNMTNDSSTTAASSASMMSTSASSSHSRARMSPTGSSILSAASSVSGSRLRMSPKSLKNTVHFSSFVTEISTSASQSYDDKISFRKLDITPKSSENFEDGAMDTVSDTDPKNLYSSGSQGGSSSGGQGSSSLLSKVNLSPSVDSTLGSPGEFHNQGFPFDQDEDNNEGELNTSDKENEFVQHNPDSSDDNYSNDPPNGRSNSRNHHVLNVYRANLPAGPIGENHPAVVKASLKSGASELDTLKGLNQECVNMIDHQYLYENGDMDLNIYKNGTIPTNCSTSSMQEDITRSYLMSKQITDNEISSYEHQYEINKPVRKTAAKALEEIPILLEPVIHNAYNSLSENRSMLEEEEFIRSHLQKVQFDDTLEEDSDDQENEDNEQMMDEAIEKYIEQEKEESKSEQPIENLIEHEKEESDSETEESIMSFPSVNEVEFQVDQQTTPIQELERAESVEDEPIISITVQEEDDTSSEQEEEHELQQPIKTEYEAPQPINTEYDSPQPIKTGEDDAEAEEEGKAEHIQKYLSQVHEQSLQHEEEFPDNEAEESECQSIAGMMDVGEMIKTFTSSIKSMNHLSQEDLFKIQAEQFELLQQKLIEQQRAQLEELFVSQRREQMHLQTDIEVYHQRIQSQDPVETIALQDSLRPKPSMSLPQVTQAWQFTPQPSALSPGFPVQQQQQQSTRSPPFPVQPVATTMYHQNNDINTSNISYHQNADINTSNMSYHQNADINTSGVRYNNSYNIMPYPGVQNAAVFQGNLMAQAQTQDPNLSYISHNSSYSVIPHHDPGVIRGNLVPNMAPHQQQIQSQNLNYSQASNPFIYPSSPSLYRNPQDTDNVSEVSGFAQATPKQLVFSNQSTPVPKVYKPVLRSPVKQPGLKKPSGRVELPDKVNDPRMQVKFARVTAVSRGYLTRRLLKTQKVQEIIKTIDDTRNFAFSFQAETPIKKGTFSRDDRILLERIVNQLQAALLDIHEIFFILPVSERMGMIALSRQQEGDRRIRQSQRLSTESVSRSQPKLSKATLRAMERKRKAQLAEEAVFGSVELRPKSAPPSTSSPHPSTDIRALRPLQGQISPIRPDSQISVREMKERPHTARTHTDRDKTKTGSGGNKTKKSSVTKTTKSSTKPSNNTTVNKQKSTTTSTTTTTATTANKYKKMDKAWR